jgi:C4-dicarboxylate-specific signal transduction histidine kinase
MQLAREQERATLALQHSEDLAALLSEREEIIRQLTLSNKTAGMGALVASFAHELNQPLIHLRAFDPALTFGRAAFSLDLMEWTLKPSLGNVLTVGAIEPKT